MLGAWTSFAQGTAAAEGLFAHGTAAAEGVVSGGVVAAGRTSLPQTSLPQTSAMVPFGSKGHHDSSADTAPPISGVQPWGAVRAGGTGGLGGGGGGVCPLGLAAKPPLLSSCPQGGRMRAHSTSP